MQPVGEHLKYIVYAKQRPVACLAWCSAPRHLGPRDRFIGWCPEARRQNIRFLAYNQPDVREHGRLFSYTLIYALNLLSLAAALTAVSSWTYAEAAGNLIDNLYFLGNAAHTFYEWALTRLPDFTA